jgi:hypothetical protein
MKVTTGREDMTIQPDITMGQRPDGSPWVISAAFCDSVSVNAQNQIWDNRKRISPHEARVRAAALFAAADWVDSAQSAKIETEAAKS